MFQHHQQPSTQNSLMNRAGGEASLNQSAQSASAVGRHPITTEEIYTVENLIPDCVGRYITTSVGAVQLSNLIDSKTYTKCWQAFVYWIASQCHLELSCNISPIGVIQFQPIKNKPVSIRGAVADANHPSNATRNASIPVFRFFQPFLDQFKLQKEADQQQTLSINDVSAQRMNLITLSKMADCETQTFRTALSHLIRRLGEAVSSKSACQFDLGVGALVSSNKTVAFRFYDPETNEAASTQLVGGATNANAGLASSLSPQEIKTLRKKYPITRASTQRAVNVPSEPLPSILAKTLTLPTLPIARGSPGLLSSNNYALTSSSTLGAPKPFLQLTGPQLSLYNRGELESLTMTSATNPVGDALPYVTPAVFQRKLRGRAPLDNIRQELERYGSQNQLPQGSSQLTVSGALLPPLNFDASSIDERIAQMRQRQLAGVRPSGEMTQRIVSSALDKFIKGSQGVITPEDAKTTACIDLSSSLVVSSPDELARARSALLAANLPPVLDSFAHTRAATFSDDIKSSPLSARVASYYTPEATAWKIDPSSQRLVHAGKNAVALTCASLRKRYTPAQLENLIRSRWIETAATATVMAGIPLTPELVREAAVAFARQKQQQAEAESFYDIHESEFSFVTVDDIAEELRQRVKSLIRYTHYVTIQMSDAVVAPVKEEWIRHALQLLSLKISASLPFDVAENLIRNLLEEIKREYIISVKQAILDYVLINPFQRARLGIPYPPPSASGSQPWGHAALLRQAPRSWRLSWQRALAIQEHSLYVNSPVMLQLLEVWTKYSDILLFDLPSTEEPPITLIQFEQRQSKHLHKVQRIFATQWTGECESVLKQYVKRYSLTDSNGSKFFDAVAALMSLQLRSIIYRSAVAYHAFFKQYVSAPSLQFNTGSSGTVMPSLISLRNPVWIQRTKDESEKIWKPVYEAADSIIQQIRSLTVHADKEQNDLYIDITKSVDAARIYESITNEELMGRLNNLPRPVFLQSLILHPSNKNESSAINFDLPLHDLEKVVVRVFDNMTHAIKEIPRVENLIFPLLDDNRMLSVHIRNERGESSPGRHIEALRSEIVQLFSRTVREAATLRELYEVYAAVFDYKDRLQQWLNAPSHQGRSLDDFRTEIMKHRHTAEEVFSKAPSEVRAVMLLVDCSHVNNEIVQQSKKHAEAVIARVAEITTSSAENVVKECQSIKVALDKELRSEVELRDREVRLSEYQHSRLPEIRLQYQESQKRLIFLVEMGHPDIKTYCERVAKAHREVVDLPHVISNAQNKTQAIRTAMEHRLSEEIARFQQTLQELNRDVLSLHTWTNRVDAVLYNNKLKEFGLKLDDAQRDASVLQEKEALLTLPQADFSMLDQVRTRLVPYQQLWSLYVEHDNKRKLWLYHSVLHLKAEEVEQQLEGMLSTASALTTTLGELQPSSSGIGSTGGLPSVGRRGSITAGTALNHPLSASNMDTPSSIAEQLRKDLTGFKAHLPLLYVMCNKGMLDRHWKEVESILGRNIKPSESMSLGKALEGMTEQTMQNLIEISEAATKQHAISEALVSMRGAWNEVTFDLHKHKEGGSWVLQTDSVEEVIALLDDHLVKTQTIKGSSFAKPSEKELNIWENWLTNTHSTIEIWAKVQADWLYLEPVFESDDIMSQMPNEGGIFKEVDLRWRALMQEVQRVKLVNNVMNIPGLGQSVREWHAHLEMIHAALKSYLENKREAFPRFYFLSNEELLEIVSETQDPTRVQRHLKKCFEGVNRLEFRENLDITAMQSSQGEEVELVGVVSPSEHKNLVEAWLGSFEKAMRETILDQIGKAHVAHSQVPRSEWLTEWPAQVILAINQVYWTHHVTMALAGGRSGDQTPQQALRDLLTRQNQELQQVVHRVRGDLSHNLRTTLGALLMMDVHNRDIVQELMTKQVHDPMSFDWTSQMRYYYTPKGGLKVAMITTELNYGYEYLGNTERLVITSLTDRCYRTLMMALKLNLGGAPEGPAGTGKTESTKDLAKACGMHCVVFNCNDMLNFQEMGQFFKGIGTTGAWICFDEFNRLQLEVLSVVAQQILAVQSAKDRLADAFVLDDKAYPLARSAAVFVTMNPGYAGRSELPDNLKALFRPVAMMVPDYSLIAQMSLFSYGFAEADTLAKKIVTTYKLCSEQLSSQDHYDYGMRAVKAVLSAARRLKRMMSDAPEDLLVYRAIVDTNEPKFLSHDIPLFDGIIRDIFPGLSAPETIGVSRSAIESASLDLSLRPNDAFVSKVVQLYETINIRHGLMLVGLPFTGKTTAWRVLQATLNNIARSPMANTVLGGATGVDVTVINPKAVLPTQLYGSFSPATHEWSDGVLSAKFKSLSNSTGSNKMWLILDGPVDAMWIEDMNTVLDDSRKLCLANRQIVPLHPNMTVMFEVRDLAVASPATVSRCGMVYLEQNVEGWRPIFQAWLSGLPFSPEIASSLEALADWLLPPILRVVYNECTQYSSQVQINLVVSLMRLFDSLMEPLYRKVRDPAAAAAEEAMRRKRQEQLDAQGLDQRLLRRRSSLAADGGVLRRESTAGMIAAAAAAGAAAAAAAANMYSGGSASVDPNLQAIMAAGSPPSGASAFNPVSRGSLSLNDAAAAATAFAAAAAVNTSSEAPTALSLEDDPNLIARMEGGFLFSLVWSAGGVVDDTSRSKFSYFVRELLRESTDYKLTVSFPKKGTVFDVLFDIESAKWVAWSDFLDLASAPSPARFAAAAMSAAPITANIAMGASTTPTSLMGSFGFNIPADAKFQEIIVPTVDSVRNYQIINLFLTNKKPLLFVGPTGTGKSVCIADTLINRMDKDSYVPLIINFSAQTSVNQTQNMIDSKLERRRRGVFGPAPAGKNLVIFCDDLNMPKPDRYGVQGPSELLRQYFDYNGWYDIHDHGFRNLIDIQFFAAMGPPGGGRNPMSDRFLRHWSQVSVAPFDDDSMTTIFSKILDWHWNIHKFGELVSGMTNRIVSATKSIYTMITTKLLPTPGRDHYTFNLRDFSRIVQGILLSRPQDSDDPDVIARLWLHEVLRVFGDRMVSDTDLTQVLNWAKDAMEKKLDVDVAALFDHLATRPGAGQAAAASVSLSGPGAISSAIPSTLSGANAGAVAPHITVDSVRSLVFGHYASRRVPKLYSEIHDADALGSIWQHYLEEYNALSPKPMKLVMFRYAVEHLSRIARILKMPGGHALLVGVGGSAKRSLTRLAASVLELELFTVEITKSYNIDAWKADLKTLLRKTGGAGKKVVFLLSDNQLTNEVFMEDINSLLNIGEVPSLWSPEDVGEITGLVQSDLTHQKRSTDGTPAQLMGMFTERVKENLHVVLCMSPIGDGFRDSLRKFPSLGNCCTIDWFRVWPQEALLSVSRAFLADVRMESDEVRESCAQLCLKFHMDARRLSSAYHEQQSRHVYVTPTSYLELISTFQNLLEEKRSKIQADRNRYIVGLEKLDSTEQKIHLMRQQLAEMQPALAKARAECEKMVETVNAETEAAMELRKNIAVKEASAQQAASLAKSIELECTRELEKAQPTLDAATEPLEHVTSAEIAELRGSKSPSKSLLAVMECLCYLRGIPPERYRDPTTLRVVTDFWPAAKRRILGADAGLLKWMQTMDKDNIPDKVIQKLQQYRNSPEFSIQALRQTSTSVLSMGLWVIAILDYDAVAKSIRPKREALARAKENSEKAEAELQRECQIMAETDARLSALRRQLEAGQKERDEVENSIRIADKKIERAQILIAGLGGQRGTWNSMSDELAVRLRDLLGDVLISSAFIAYLGGYTQSYREATLMQWIQHCHSLGISTSPRFVLHKVLGEPLAIRNWVIAGLPNDSFSIDNAVMVRVSRRWPLMIDPQGQANNWIRRMEDDNGLVIVKLTDADFHRQLEIAIRRGAPVLLEDVGCEIDSAIQPLLMRQVVRRAGQWFMRFGDQEIEYSDQFRLYITTSLRNPHFLPELGTQVALINFMITPEGLQDQLLGYVVSQERPHLEHERSQLIVKMHHNQAKLKENEDKILDVLRDSKGDILDDEKAVEILTESRRISQEIEIKEQEAATTEKEIESTRSGYRPVATHGQILFFCVSQLAHIDSMYQFSLPWYADVFKRAITVAAASSDRVQRIQNICDTLTSLLYSIVCRSLFERHKLSFAMSISVNLALNRMRTLVKSPTSRARKNSRSSNVYRTETESDRHEVEEDEDEDEDQDEVVSDHEEPTVRRSTRTADANLLSPGNLGAHDPTNTLAHPKVTSAVWWFILKGSLSVGRQTSSTSNTSATTPAPSANTPDASSGPSSSHGSSTTLSCPQWMSERPWFELVALSTLPDFNDLDKSFASSEHSSAWRQYYEATDPQNSRLPGDWQGKLDSFARLALLRAVRPDKLLAASRTYVEATLGPKFVQTQTFDLAGAFAETRTDTPVLFILSEGSDPLASFMSFVREERMTDRCQSISLGQGQGPIATLAIQRACTSGGWVLLQNCHLAESWLPDLERICREITAATEAKKVRSEFRLVLTSYPTSAFPISILERSVKLVQQPPIGLKSNLSACYSSEPLNSEKWYEACERRAELKSLSFALAFFHCLVQERRGFGSLGWNIPYGFNNTDLVISLRQLHMFLNETHRDTEIPLTALHYLTAECNYGGRVTDDWDRRTLSTLLSRFYSPEVITVARCPLSDSGIYTVPPPDSSATGCLEHVERFPPLAAPEVFGLHENAEITRNLRDSQTLIDALVASTHSSASSLGAVGGENTAASAQLRRTNVLLEHASTVLNRLPPLFEIEKVQTKYPIRYEESMNAVLIQECSRFNKLTTVIVNTLQNLVKSLKGVIVTSSEMEDLGSQIYDGKVPDQWLKISYPTKKPFASFINDLVMRLSCLEYWISAGQPSVTWFSGFFFPQSFLTACLQNYVRRHRIAIDTVGFTFEMLDPEAINERSPMPEDGAYISGLFLDGAVWSWTHRSLADAPPRVTYSQAPIIWLRPQPTIDISHAGRYICPTYRTSDRRGTLTTTGHSTNFIIAVAIPTIEPEQKWIRRGVALISQLDD